MTTATLKNTPRAVSPLSTLGAQTKAELLAMFRNPSSLIPTVLFPIMFWVFFGLPNARETSSSGFSVGAYILGSYAMYSMIQTVLFNLGIFIASERSTGWYRFQRTTAFPATPRRKNLSSGDEQFVLLESSRLIIPRNTIWS